MKIDNKIDDEEIIGELIDAVEDWMTEQAESGKITVNSKEDAFIKGNDYDSIAERFKVILKQ